MAAAPHRRLRYQVVMSLDGFIAGPKGEADWIPMDPDIDFAAHFAQFDTLVLGRKTFVGMAGQGSVAGGKLFGKDTIVVSRTLTAAAYPGVTIVKDDVAKAITALKAKPGPAATHQLELTSHRVFEKTGLLMLEYAVRR